MHAHRVKTDIGDTQHSWLKRQNVTKQELYFTCPRMEKNRAGWKKDVRGRTQLSLSKGLDRLMVMKETDMSMPKAVICLSPYFTPSR